MSPGSTVSALDRTEQSRIDALDRPGLHPDLLARHVRPRVQPHKAGEEVAQHRLGRQADHDAGDGSSTGN